MENYKPVGLRNTTNFHCYAVAVVQALLAVPEFRRFVMTFENKKNVTVVRLLEILLTSSNDDDVIVQLAKSVGAEFGKLEEQDAKQFMRQMLKKIGFKFYSSSCKIFKPYQDNKKIRNNVIVDAETIKITDTTNKTLSIQKSNILSLIIHEGKELNTGHFSTIVRGNEFSWYYCNDEYVEHIDDINLKFADNSTSLQNTYIMILNE